MNIRMLLQCIILLALSGISMAEPYTADWESLSRHQDPEWLSDAKFGIYTHWGPVTYAIRNAPTSMGWYARKMYKKGTSEFKFHLKEYGNQNTFGFKDFIPLFTASEFDADEWAELFKSSGARFAGPVVVHHDNFCLWDSKVTRWNSVKMGPKRDITGELEKAIRKRGMKFITTFHHSFTWTFYRESLQFDGKDPQFADLYTDPTVPHTGKKSTTKEYNESVLAKVNEVVNKYSPDLIWFDFGLRQTLKDEYPKRIFADYYNWAAKNNREVGIAHKHWELHVHSGIIDFERGRMDHLTAFPWMTDSSTGPWFYNKNAKYRTANEIIDTFIDIVSKNGILLLNVGPDYKGRIPEVNFRILKEIGNWIKVNGEGIFKTRPWLTFGEGPTRVGQGAFSELNEKKYTAEDIRFTRSKDGKKIYVFILAKPEGDIVVRSMKVDDLSNGSIRLLGYNGKISARMDNQQHLVIQTSSLKPDQLLFDNAVCFELSGYKLSLHEDAQHKPRLLKRGDIKSKEEHRDINDSRNE